MKTLALILSLFLTACAVSKLDLQEPGGAHVTASATSLTASGTVSFTMTRDAKGAIQSVTFLRTDTIPLDLVTKLMGVVK